MSSENETWAKLLMIQSALKAPKSRTNEFGGFQYRSAEDILLAVKPLLQKHSATLLLSDNIEEVGGWHYVKAVAIFRDLDNGSEIRSYGLAREQEHKTKMDASQVTGAASSYARKYALSGLLLLDHGADADAMDNRHEITKKALDDLDPFDL